VPSPVDWALAERIATRLTPRDPFADSYLYESLATDFVECTAEAEELVAAETGLRSAAGPARSKVVDRAAWVSANVRAFQRLLHPMLDRLADRAGGNRSIPLAVTRKVSAFEVGSLLAWMSGRVLGQYDLLVIDDASATDQDLVYYVGPNVLSLERRYGFPPREFRLWLALHEVTHRAQFTGVPWMRQHYLGLVQEALSMVDTDPGQLLSALRSAASGLRQGRDAFDLGGLAAVIASEEQRVALGKVAGLMALLEGHGDVTMDRAGAGRVPSAERFSRVLRERRKAASPLARAFRRLIGLEAKLAQYEYGEQFLSAVEDVAGDRAIATVWEGPERLPTLAEIKQPQTWLARVGLAGVPAAPAPA
jgi:coenzyme F420 biosynthesis associated uncharacterized protein